MQWPSLPRRRSSVGLLGVSFPSGGCGGGHSNRRRLLTTTSMILESLRAGHHDRHR